VNAKRRAARLERCASISDLREFAQRRLPRPLFDFVDGGAGAETTLRENEEAFARLRLMPRYPVDVSRRSARTTILGYNAWMPLILAPVGFAGLLFPDGEQGAARAAAHAEIPFCLSTNSLASVEEIGACAQSSERWFQLYFLKDRAWMQTLVRRAAASGFRVLCVTIDLPVAGRRARDIRNGFALPLRPTLRTALEFATRLDWLRGVAGKKRRIGNFEGLAKSSNFTGVAELVASLFDPSATWDDVAQLREAWRGPLVVKGVMHPEDALRAIEIGAEAIVVSNHGGRQLEDAPATMDVLSDVVAAVNRRIPIFVDGGVRRGVDVLKAIALGATACMIGRAFAWGLAAGGEQGVARALSILAAETDVALALLGVTSTAELGEHHLWRGAAS
jgi:isopentenyl diphosphate isomerase/L-lactate dehydrogenase-like FMN-dependent dehydrogenase